MIKIKLSIPGVGNKINLSQFLGNVDNTHQNCKFYVNDADVKEVDFWFVIDDLQQSHEEVFVDPEHVYFITGEQVHSLGHYDSLNRSKFLDQFAKIVSCYDIFRDNAEYDLPFLSWMINANHGPSLFESSIRDLNWFQNLSKISKTRTLSVFCSKKIITPEHQARYKFVKLLKNHFGDLLDWYGNGISSIPAKWDGIAPYKYHIVLENQSRHNIISEKIYDSYLGLAYPIYWGAPNLSDYFPKDSFSSIEILDWRGAIRTIEELLSNDPWESKLPSLIKSKNIVITDLNIYSRLAKLANEQSYLGRNTKRLTRLYSISNCCNRISVKFGLNLSGRILKRLGENLMEKSKNNPNYPNN